MEIFQNCILRKEKPSKEGLAKGYYPKGGNLSNFI